MIAGATTWQGQGNHTFTTVLPASLEFGTTNVHEGPKIVNETHNLQNDQGADEF